MEEYKKNFINFMVDSQVLKFGEFTLKSGRKSPFFMNAGAYKTGSQLVKLGEYYAKAINDKYGLNLTFCSALHIRAYRWQLLLLWRSANFTGGISNTAATARRSKTTVTRGSFSEPPPRRGQGHDH